jgi:replication-associated recombination protein RarA
MALQPGSSAANAAAAALARLKAALSPTAATARATISPLLQPPGGVLLWGAPGSGRSAVAHALAKALRDDAATLAAVVTVNCGSLPAG